MIYVMKSPIGLEFGLGLESGISMGINVRLRVMVMVRLEVRVPNGTNFFLKCFQKFKIFCVIDRYRSNLF